MLATVIIWINTTSKMGHCENGVTLFKIKHTAMRKLVDRSC